MIEGFIELMQDGQSLCVGDVRNAFYGLPEKRVYDCLIDLADKTKRIFKICVPVTDDLDEDERAFVNSYIHAEVESTLSVLGSKDVTVCFKISPKSLMPLKKQLESLFCLRKIASKDAPSKVIVVSDDSVEIKYADRTGDIEKKTICGFCISSNGIKGTIVSGGNLCCLKEYTWLDEEITDADWCCDAVYILTRLMRVQLSLNVNSGILSPEDRILFQQDLTNAMQKEAAYDQIAVAVKTLEKELKGNLIGIDAVGLNFPDAQLKDRMLRMAESPKKVTLYNADEDIDDSGLIVQLEDHPEVSIMQFANAIAAVYHANLTLLAK